MADINKAFYTIKKCLQSHGKHFAAIVCNSSCEAWINAEAVAALNRYYNNNALHRNKGEYAISESRKRDIVIYSKSKVSHVIEVKVLYPWDDFKLLNEKLKPLKSQIDRRKDDEPVSVSRTGLIFGVWIYPYDNKYARHNHPESKADEFFDRLTLLTQEVFPSSDYTTQHKGIFERVFKNPIRAPYPHDCLVQVGALYITKR